MTVMLVCFEACICYAAFCKEMLLFDRREFLPGFMLFVFLVCQMDHVWEKRLNNAHSNVVLNLFKFAFLSFFIKKNMKPCFTESLAFGVYFNMIYFVLSSIQAAVRAEPVHNKVRVFSCDRIGFLIAVKYFQNNVKKEACTHLSP